MLAIVVEGDDAEVDEVAVVLLDGWFFVEDGVTGATATAIWSPANSSSGVEYPVDGTWPIMTSPVKVALRASAFAKLPGV